MSEHRVKMGEDDLRKLVQGEVVELRTATHEKVLVILEDIGLDRIYRAVNHAPQNLQRLRDRE